MTIARGWLAGALVPAACLGLWLATDHSRAADENKAIKADILKIADAEAMLRAGHRDMEGLLQQLMDRATERRLLSDTGGSRMETTWA